MEGVSKSYGRVRALRDVDLRLEKGRVFCLLGPNGAGKTTLVKGVLDLVRFDAGGVRIAGCGFRKSEARRTVAYLPERFSFYPYYSVHQLVAFYASLYGVDPRGVGDCLDRMGVADLKNKKIGKLSKGQLQRAALAAVWSGDREIVVLDEPFSGMDPIGIADLKKNIMELRGLGRTVLINTHILGEIGSLCDDFAILVGGKIVAAGRKDALLAGRTLEEFFYEKVKGDGL